ncbi:MAG TPA: hypothetical protein VE977_13945 [Pyrinomonadaceae bacterium]|nr:hypothetical protein [Pyrinomonadaceae bacterium]
MHRKELPPTGSPPVGYQADAVVLLVRAELPNITNNRFKQGL